MSKHLLNFVVSPVISNSLVTPLPDDLLLRTLDYGLALQKWACLGSLFIYSFFFTLTAACFDVLPT